jgi:phenylpyruvate tautomerase PptA (4-oxalocrotonate tautomerase family)
MPMLELTYPEGALQPDARALLVEQLTAALMRWEGAPDTAFFRQATWALIHERPAWAINRAGPPRPPGLRALRHRPGRRDERPPQGRPRRRGHQAHPRRRRPRPRSAAHLGSPPRDPDGNWGAVGQIIQFAELREAAKQARESAAQGANTRGPSA